MHLNFFEVLYFGTCAQLLFFYIKRAFFPALTVAPTPWLLGESWRARRSKERRSGCQESYDSNSLPSGEVVPPAFGWYRSREA